MRKRGEMIERPLAFAGDGRRPCGESTCVGGEKFLKRLLTRVLGLNMAC